MAFKCRNLGGFTLMEMLIVVAIIAVLVSIAIPTFTAQLTRARAAVDQANVRSAKAAAAMEFMSSGARGPQTYYFNGSTAQSSPDGIGGYGKSSMELTGDLDDHAGGVPEGGYVAVTVNADGTLDAEWKGGAGGGGQEPSTPSPVFTDPRFLGTASRGNFQTWGQITKGNHPWKPGEVIVERDSGLAYINVGDAQDVYKGKVGGVSYPSVTDYYEKNPGALIKVDKSTKVMTEDEMKSGASYSKGALFVDSAGRIYVATGDNVTRDSLRGETQKNGWARLH